MRQTIQNSKHNKYHNYAQMTEQQIKKYSERAQHAQNTNYEHDY